MGLEITEGQDAVARPAPKNSHRNKPSTTPPLSERIKEDANRIEYATDSTGRQIGVRRMNALAMFEITLSLGEHSSNQGALMQALAAASVCEIDGETVRMPRTMLEIKALMKRLDFAGLAAANEALSRFTENTEANTDAAKN